MLLIVPLSAIAQKNKSANSYPITSKIVSGMKFRSIGPGYTSGRISDIAVNPNNHAEIYVATASGGIWKTEDAGITFKPIFDHYGSYSIGCITIDPNNPHVIWTGTGEGNFQRSVSYGDGVYKSLDGGKTWKNMGLRSSQHIGKIVVDPRNSNIVYVAAEGSVWGPGGDRGLYKTTDGGKTWKRILYVDEWTGVNDVVLDPRDPNVIYATTSERCRHVWTKIGGGPTNAIYKSEDGGKTWRKLTNGIPSGWKGKISLAIAPSNPDILYAMIYGEGKNGGFFRSTDRGESWTRMSDYNTSGQYFDKIFVDPHNPNKIYSLAVVSKVSTDGGKTWHNLGLNGKHVDDHALWIDPSNTNHLLVGCDGGLYETWDGGKHWRHFGNIPAVQFYRVYVDVDTPFYHVYGGTQDNNSMGGPAKNQSSYGVTACDWVTTVGGDGFWGMVDPKNPNIVYSEYQYGNIYRYDRKSGERLYIKPRPLANQKTFRWNWNTPFLISHHDHKRLYIAANVVFESDDMGNSWKIISPDLTRHLDRNSLKCMGKYWPFDAVGKDVSTSLYGTIVSMDESPVQDGLLYVGTDDGLIQVTEDNGKHWRKIDNIPGVPKYAYVSDILADNFDANTVYATFDNHKQNDFKPYVYVSHDKGHTWQSISSNLPDTGTVYTIAQDFKDPNLLFVGTEFGIYFSVDAGKHWVRLKAGIPTIAVRDIAIQKQESDLVLATFGRGIYILDDYSPLRKLSPDFVKNTNAFIFPIRPAYLYIQTSGKYGQGTDFFVAKNPPFGVTFYYYLKNTPKTEKQLRHEKEMKLWKQGKPIPQITWKQYQEEQKQTPPYLIFTIYDSQGNVIRNITAKPKQGINRVTWNLRYASPQPIKALDKFDPFKENKDGILVTPGKYYVSMALYNNGQFQKLTDKVPFIVRPLHNRTIEGNPQQIFAFEKQVTKITRVILADMNYASDLNKQLNSIKLAILSAPVETQKLMTQAINLQKQLDSVIFAFRGVKPRASYEEIPPHKLPIYYRLQYLMEANYQSLGPITQTEKQQLQILQQQLPEQIQKLKNITQQLKQLEQQLNMVNAPWTPGRLLDYKK